MGQPERIMHRGMAQGNHKEPMRLLRELELRSRNHAHGLPQQEELREGWSGIAFSMGEHDLLAPLGEVVEILTYPNLSRVPGVKPWVLGVANVRGNLLPIMDLASYLSGNKTVLNKRSRVLVMNYNGIFAGLLVDGVTGLRRVEQEELTAELPDSVNSAFVPYLDHAYRSETEFCAIFSMHRLAENPTFLQVAI